MSLAAVSTSGGGAIHPTALVDPGAIIGEGTSIGAYSIIGPKVRIGRHNRIGHHVVIEGHTTIGDENTISPFASLGGAPQDLKYKGEDTELLIGDRNVIREYVTLHPGTATGRRRTTIGDGNLFMANSHVGHDGIVGSQNVFANSCALAGHVTIGSGVVIGGLCGIHQFARVGDFAFLGGGAMINRDVPPFCLAQGDRATLGGINRIGLRRRGISGEEIRLLGHLYRTIFYGEGERFEEVAARERSASHRGDRVAVFLAFFENSKRGYAVPRSRKRPQDDDVELG